MQSLAPIDNNAVVCRVIADDIEVTGNIDHNSVVFLESTTGKIIVDGNIDNSSNVTLKAVGSVQIGKAIDNGSSVAISAGGPISIGNYVHGSTVDLKAHDAITVAGNVDSSAAVRMLADGDITVGDKIDGSSRAELVSNRGNVTIQKKVGGGSKVWLTAGNNVRIGQTGGDGDKRIDTDSFVSATAGGAIDHGGQIADSHTAVDFAACGSIAIGNGISGGATVRLLSSAAKITMGGAIADSNTRVTSFPAKALVPTVQGGATFVQDEWAAAGPLCLASAQNGSWWENWSQTFGYVAPNRLIPRSYDDLVAAVTSLSAPSRTAIAPVKAVGGGWSFTDASLPIETASDVDKISLLLKGRPGQQDMHGVLDGLPDSSAAPMDLLPGAVLRDAQFSTMYDQKAQRAVTASGAQLPSIASNATIIDTRGLASSLNCDFRDIAAMVINPAGRPVPSKEILFHVEAGITVADLQLLLDHQFPRLAMHATGGSPGATLAGTLSTATHGGEFRDDWPLLVDCVRAIHLIGPGGTEWWIEGDIPVADPGKLAARYPKVQFIGGTAWTGIPGLTPQDVLNAVTVSMGTMGVIYSVVLSVVRQFGLRQIVHPTNWNDLVKNAGATISDLQKGLATANTAIHDFLIDGSKNGTGIDKTQNVYVDLAINPLNEDCWILNRMQTPIPDDENDPPASIGDYMNAFLLALARKDNFQGDRLLGRVFDFFQWHTDLVGFGAHNIGDVLGLFKYVTSLPDAMAGTAALACVQALANIEKDPGDPDRGLPFFSDLLSGFFHAMEGTLPELNADSTAVSYKLGAIGWPASGVPGRGLEIALDPTNAFTFLQTVIFDDVLANIIEKQNNPILGYISVRITPQTRTLLGMQQYAPHSIMIEVVAYRSPQANVVMDAIQERALAFSGPGPKPILHWGLENAMMNATHLAASPLGQPYKGSMTRLDAFRTVRSFLRGANPPIFDNAFTARMGI